MKPVPPRFRAPFLVLLLAVAAAAGELFVAGRQLVPARGPVVAE